MRKVCLHRSIIIQSDLRHHIHFMFPHFFSPRLNDGGPCQRVWGCTQCPQHAHTRSGRAARANACVVVQPEQASRSQRPRQAKHAAKPAQAQKSHVAAMRKHSENGCQTVPTRHSLTHPGRIKLGSSACCYIHMRGLTSSNRYIRL